MICFKYSSLVTNKKIQQLVKNIKVLIDQKLYILMEITNIL